MLTVTRPRAGTTNPVSRGSFRASIRATGRSSTTRAFRTVTLTSLLEVTPSPPGAPPLVAMKVKVPWLPTGLLTRYASSAVLPLTRRRQPPVPERT